MISLVYEPGISSCDHEFCFVWSCSASSCLVLVQCKDAEHRLAAAKKANQKMEAQFQELKSSGSGLTELNRESINKCVSSSSGCQVFYFFTQVACTPSSKPLRLFQ